TFIPAGTCIPPSDVAVATYTSTSATVAWNEAAAGSTFDIEYGPAGFSPGTGLTITGITDTFRVVTGLNSYADYEFYVAENCVGGNGSPAAGPVSVLTAVTDGWKEEFTATHTPNGWYEAQGGLANPTTFTSTTAAGWV